MTSTTAAAQNTSNVSFKLVWDRDQIAHVFKIPCPTTLWTLEVKTKIVEMVKEEARRMLNAHGICPSVQICLSHIDADKDDVPFLPELLPSNLVGSQTMYRVKLGTDVYGFDRRDNPLSRAPPLLRNQAYATFKLVRPNNANAFICHVPCRVDPLVHNSGLNYNERKTILEYVKQEATRILAPLDANQEVMLSARDQDGDEVEIGPDFIPHDIGRQWDNPTITPVRIRIQLTPRKTATPARLPPPLPPKLIHSSTTDTASAAASNLITVINETFFASPPATEPSIPQVTASSTDSDLLNALRQSVSQVPTRYQQAQRELLNQHVKADAATSVSMIPDAPPIIPQAPPLTATPVVSFDEKTNPVGAAVWKIIHDPYLMREVQTVLFNVMKHFTENDTFDMELLLQLCFRYGSTCCARLCRLMLGRESLSLMEFYQSNPVYHVLLTQYLAVVRKLLQGSEQRMVNKFSAWLQAPETQPFIVSALQCLDETATAQTKLQWVQQVIPFMMTQL